MIAPCRILLDRVSKYHSKWRECSVRWSLAVLGLCVCILSLATTMLVGQDKSAPEAPAQDVKAALTGTVSDQTGAGVAGATVTMDNGKGAAPSVTTDSQGLYAITDLAAGSYTLSVVSRGAKIFQASVSLSPGQVLTMSVAGAPVAQPDQSSPPQAAQPTSPVGPAGSTAPPASSEQPAGALPPAPALVPAAPTHAQAAPPAESAPTPTPTAAEQTVPSAAPQVVSTPGTFSGPGIGGLVTDQTGAVLVGATIEVRSASGVMQTAVSDDKGNYAIRGLPAGSYNIKVTMKGFKSFEAPGVALATEQSLPLDALLEPATEQAEVNVSGQGVGQVETETSQVSGTITEKEVLSLGLNGRNFTQLIALTPGVSNQTGQDEAHVGITGSVKYSVNGGRVEYNTFEADGSDVLNAGLNGAESTLIVYPSLDAIQEVKVLTSNYGAMYGRTASGTVMVTTKTGTPHWHGDGYEFLRNEALNARNYFDPPGKAPYYRRNDFGGTIGGPLWIPGVYNQKKDKTFIFFSEEARIEKSPNELRSDFNQAVPTIAERQGNFSDVCPNPNDPQDAKQLTPIPGAFHFQTASFPDCPAVPGLGNTPGVGTLFVTGNPNAGNAIYNNIATANDTKGGVQAGLDPNAVAILNQNLIPLPNSFIGCNSNLVGKIDHTTGQLIMPCYDAVISTPTHWREELFRIDHNFNSHLQGTFRFIHDSWDTITPTPNWGTVTNTFPTVQNKFVGPGIDMVVRLTQTISPSLLNETVFSFTNSHITLAAQNGPGGANFQRPAGLGNPTQVSQCPVPGTGTGVVACPMGYFFNNGFGGKVPGVIVAGNNQDFGGSGFTVDPSYVPWEHTNPTYNFRDDLSKAFGKHTLQIGVQLVLAQKNETNAALGAATGDLQGLLTVSNVNGGIYSTGNAFANFLYNDGFNYLSGGGDAIKSYLQDSTQLRYYNRYQIAEPFVQDDWRVTSRITVNLGIRFSLFGNYHEKYLR